MAIADIAKRIKKGRNSFLVILTTLFLSTFAFAEYEPLKDQTWELCRDSSMTVRYAGHDLTLKYQYCTSSGDIKPEFVEKEVVKATQAVFKFADTVGVRGSECVQNNKLEIYTIDMAVLNDKDRFDWAVNNPEADVIWALYDPRNSEEDVSSIMLTDHGDSWNKILLSHEVSHYWYHRLCWNKDWKKKAEQFAIDFETFYKEQK